jgi:hypothetical protein
MKFHRIIKSAVTLPTRVLFVAVLCVALAAAEGSSRRPLRFRWVPDSNQTLLEFQVMQMTDLHYTGKSASLLEKDALTQQTQRRLLLRHQPVDLVMFTGDMVSGGWLNDTAAQGRAGRATLWRWFTQPLLETGTSWASALGNHDTDSAAPSREHLVRLDQAQSAELCHTREDGRVDVSGAANYWLEVLGPVDSEWEQQTLAAIWVLDTQDRVCQGMGPWGCADVSQVQWYLQESEALRQRLNRTRVYGLLYQHIPLPEVVDLWDYGVDVRGHRVDKGTRTARVNQGLYAALLARQAEVRGVYFGHDHTNDYVGEWLGGIQLGYGRKTGHNSYGPKAGLGRGARMVRLRVNITHPDPLLKPPLLETWVALETGGVDRQEPSPVPGPRLTEEVKLSVRDHANAMQFQSANSRTRSEHSVSMTTESTAITITGSLAHENSVTTSESESVTPLEHRSVDQQSSGGHIEPSRLAFHLTLLEIVIFTFLLTI